MEKGNEKLYNITIYNTNMLKINDIRKMLNLYGINKASGFKLLQKKTILEEKLKEVLNKNKNELKEMKKKEEKKQKEKKEEKKKNDINYIRNEIKKLDKNIKLNQKKNVLKDILHKKKIKIIYKKKYYVYIKNDNIYNMEWSGKGVVSPKKTEKRLTDYPLQFNKKPTNLEILQEFKDRMTAENEDGYQEIAIKSTLTGRMCGPKFNNNGNKLYKWFNNYVDELELNDITILHVSKPMGKERYENIALYQTSAIIDPSIGANLNYVHNNLCVPDILMQILDDTQAYKQMSYNEIILKICDIKGILNKNENFNYHEKLILNKGGCMNDIIKFMAWYGGNKIGVTILDTFNKVIYEKSGSHNKAIIKISNDHAYYVSDVSIKKEISQTGYIKQKQLINIDMDLTNMPICDNMGELYETIKNIDAKILIAIAEDWREVIECYITQSNSNICKYNNNYNRIISFQCPITEKIIIIKEREEYEQEQNILDYIRNYKDKIKNNTNLKNVILNDDLLKYHGYNVSSIYSVLEKHFIGIIPKSYYESNIKEYIFEKFKRPSLYESYTRKNMKKYIKGLNEEGRDISKAHSYAKMNLLDDIPIYSEHDKIEYYRGEEIECGLYRVKSFYLFKNTRNKCVFCPDGFYTSGFIKKLLENNIISKNMITEKYIPTAHIDKNLYKNINEFIFTVFSEKDAKMISNCGTGMTGKKWIKSMCCAFETSDNIAETYRNDGHFCPKMGQKDLYLIGKRYKKRMYGNNLPIYFSILDSSYWHLYECMKECITDTTIITSIHTDAINGYGLKPLINIEYKTEFEKIGSLHEQLFQNIDHEIYNDREIITNWINVKIDENNIKLSHKDTNEFKNYVKNSLQENELYIGEAGCGKSTLLSEKCSILRKQNIKFLAISPSNKSVDSMIKNGIIEAQTMHKGLITNIDGNEIEKYQEENECPFEYIFVDEAYTMNTNIFRVLYKIYLKNKGIIFQFFGDRNQCLPVEKNEINNNGIVYDYESSPAFNSMINNHKTILQYISECGRYDDKLYNICKNVQNNKLCIFNELSDNTKIIRYISKLNKICDIQNIKYMEDGKDIFIIPQNKTGSKSQITELKLNKNMLVTPYKTGINFYNNQDFIYISFNKIKKEVHLKAINNNANIIIPLNIFKNAFICAYAMTVDRIQGSTIEGNYAINFTGMKKNDIYVAISRARKYNNIYVTKQIDTIIPYTYEKDKKIDIFNFNKTGYIYQISNNENDKTYIGRTIKTIDIILKEHINGKRQDKFHTYIKNNIKMEWKIKELEKVTFKLISELAEKEKNYIQSLKPYFNTTQDTKENKNINQEQNNKKKYRINNKSVIIEYKENGKYKHKQINFKKIGLNEAIEQAEKFIASNYMKK